MYNFIYVAFINKSKHKGVKKKIENFTNSLNYSSNIIIYDKFDNSFIKYLYRYVVLLFVIFYQLTNKEVKVYFRQTSFLPFLSLFTRFFNYTYEVNAYLPKEANLRTSNRFLLSLMNDNNVIMNAKHVVFISSELRCLYKHELLNYTILPNSIKNLPQRINRSNNRNIIFVGNDSQSWQGVDKYIKLSFMYPNFNFYFAGVLSVNTKTPDNFIYLGYLDHTTLKKFYKKVDLAISSLNFLVSGLTEASPLKSREYIENNLCILCGYVDSEYNDFPFIRKFCLETFEDDYNSLLNIYPSDFDLSMYTIDYKINRLKNYL